MSQKQTIQTRPRKRTVKTLEAQIVKCKDNIARERDKLRELISEVREIEESCDEALDGLERAADALSQYL